MKYLLNEILLLTAQALSIGAVRIRGIGRPHLQIVDILRTEKQIYHCRRFGWPSLLLWYFIWHFIWYVLPGMNLKKKRKTAVLERWRSLWKRILHPSMFLEDASGITSVWLTGSGWVCSLKWWTLLRNLLFRSVLEIKESCWSPVPSHFLKKSWCCKIFIASDAKRNSSAVENQDILGLTIEPWSDSFIVNRNFVVVI